MISYVVGQRRTEIGVRMALGAGAEQVAAMVMAQSLRLAVAGVLVGVLAVLGATRVLGSVPFEVSTTDPFVFATVAVMLIGVALLASFLPAARSPRVDPARTLRSD